MTQGRAAVQVQGRHRDPADLVVMAVGIRPNTALAESMRLHCNRGIVVNDTMQTVTDPRIYAWANARRTAASPTAWWRRCSSRPRSAPTTWRSSASAATPARSPRPSSRSPASTCSGRRLHGRRGHREIVMSDPFGGVYKKLVIKDDKLVGACLYGDTVDGSWYFKLLRDGRSVGDIRDKLMFGESNIGDVGHQGHSKAAAMADSDEVCGCNGVTKGTICKAIKEKGLFTLDEVRKHTKASASCGSCTGLVEQILMFTAGGDYTPRPSSRPCAAAPTTATRPCATPSAQQHLLTIGDVFRRWNGRRPTAAPAAARPSTTTCISTWPKEAKDDPQSRFINERSHANIQKDGTYSVIPRMWGGETTPASCAASPTRWTSTRSPPSRSPAASASTCWA
jgi:nitrite reductase (NADH) large subunit